MTAFETYHIALWGILITLLTVLVQSVVGSLAKASQPGAVPGKINEDLGHASFVFRSHRTFMNSLENVPVMLGAAFLAILAGANAFWTGLLIWIFALARIQHMILYYSIATERNPSPRSYFFLIAFLAVLGLLGFAAAALL